MTPAAAIDAVVGVALLAFLAWGAFHGALRQFLGLAVLAVAFALAPVLSPFLEGTVRKLADLDADDLVLVSWSLALVGVAAACSVVLHAARGPVGRRRIGGGFDRWIGGLVGAAKGAVVLGVLVFGVLVWYAREDGPDAVRALRASRTARAVVAAERGVRPALRLPEPVERRVEQASRRVGVEEAPP